MSRNHLLCLSTALLLPIAACGTPTPEQAPAPAAPAGLARYELPATVTFPEGIARDAATGALYTASAADGTVVRVNADTGAAEVVAAAGTLMPAGTETFPGVLGMELDDRNRLWLAGGRTARMWVLDTSTGQVVGNVVTPTADRSLINDLAIVDGAGYFTDTFVPTLWRLPARGNAFGNLEPWLDLTGTAIEYGEGANLNGITATPDGRTLIVVHMGRGLLYTIDVATKAIAPIDTGGEDLTGADGLVLDGDILYVVRQTAVEVATLRLSADRASATVINRFKDPGLAWPATAVLAGSELVVVNTQFNTRDAGNTTTPFTLLRVPVARLAGPQ